MPDQVLVLTRGDDSTSAAVVDELQARDVPVVRCDPAEVLAGRVSLIIRVDGGPSILSTDSGELDLSRVRSVYHRQTRDGMGGVLAGIRARWVNHIWRSLEADFRPTQLTVARELGFDVPPTLITTVPTEARAFADAHQRVRYQPLHRSELYGEDGAPPMLWGDDDRDNSGASTVHLFQECVEKVADVRTMVIGRNVFSVRIGSVQLDRRRDEQAITYRVIDTPAEVTKACRRYLGRFGLWFGTFDFGLGEDGRWTWCEFHGGGDWRPLELATGLPLTTAMADLLEHADY